MNQHKEKIVVIGFGWVGQANALALTILGYHVYYYDVVNPSQYYRETHSHLYDAITPLSAPLEKDGPDTWYVIAVGDRVKENGEQDISLILKANELLKNAKGGVILRSTMLPAHLAKFRFDFYVPEFLHEKQAVEECVNPFYFVVGRSDAKPEPSFFAEWELRAHKTFRGTPAQASYIKYLSNIWNSVRIAFVNEFGDVIGDPKNPAALAETERVIDFVLGKKNYLRYGRAYSGHCLPKDVFAFFTAHKNDKNVSLMKAVHETNLHHHALIENAGHVPEWFSSWVNDDAYQSVRRNRALEFWQKMNALPAARALRRKFRFVVKGIERLVPNKDLAATAVLWNNLARKNPRYYVSPKTPGGRYANEFEVRETGAADYKQYIQGDALLRDWFGDFKQKKAIQIGCGIGRMTEFMAGDFGEVHGIDISPVMIDHARKRLMGTRNVVLTTNDGVSIPASDGAADFCFSYQTFQHVPQKSVIQKYFEEMRRVLKHGGLAKVHVRTGLPPYKWNHFYGVSLTTAEVKDMAQAAGLQLLRCEPEQEKYLWLTLQKS